LRVDTGSALQLDTAVTFNTSDPSSVLFVHAGTITGSGSLVKTGPGQIIIDNASSYSGGTELKGGTVTIRNGGALGTGAIDFGPSSTATLRSEASTTVNNRISLG